MGQTYHEVTSEVGIAFDESARHSAISSSMRPSLFQVPKNIFYPDPEGTKLPESNVCKDTRVPLTLVYNCAVYNCRHAAGALLEILPVASATSSGMRCRRACIIEIVMPYG